MKKVFFTKQVACIAIITFFFIFTGCKKDKDGFSPPKWIQGEWIIPDQAEYRFTSNNIVFVYFSEGFYTEMIFNTLQKRNSIEETKKSDNEYELTLIEREGSTRVYNFKKGDGTYIDLEYDNNRNIVRLIKKNL